MSRPVAIAIDLAAIAVAVWALWSPSFDGLLPGNLLPILATIVIFTSLWRLWHRARGRR